MVLVAPSFPFAFAKRTSACTIAISGNPSEPQLHAYTAIWAGRPLQAVLSLVLAIKEGRAKGHVSVPEPSDIGTRRGESFRTIDSKRKEAHIFFGYFFIAEKSSYP